MVTRMDHSHLESSPLGRQTVRQYLECRGEIHNLKYATAIVANTRKCREAFLLRQQLAVPLTNALEADYRIEGQSVYTRVQPRMQPDARNTVYKIIRCVYVRYAARHSRIL